MTDLSSYRNYCSMVRSSKRLTRQDSLPFSSIKRRHTSALMFSFHMSSLLEWNPTLKQIFQSFSEMISKIHVALKLSVKFNKGYMVNYIMEFHPEAKPLVISYSVFPLFNT